jgi:hypothetical protein
VNLIERKIILETNDETRFLQLSRFRHSGGKVFSAQLTLRSAGFACDREVLFDLLEEFVRQLESMEKTLKGKAVLGEQHSAAPCLQLEIDTQGHVLVEGVIEDERLQRLKYRFETDQTCLSAFAGDLRQVKSSAEKE